MILEIPKKKNAKYKPYLVTVKNSLKNIIDNPIIEKEIKDKNFIKNDLENDSPVIIKIINDMVEKTNKIVFHTYNFLKLYILQFVNDEKNIKIDIPLIRKIMNVVTYKNQLRGKKPIRDNVVIALEKLYNKYYDPLLKNEDIINRDALKYILNYEEKDILKNITTNIKKHFITHLRFFIWKKFEFDKGIRETNLLTFKTANINKKDKNKEQKLKDIKTLKKKLIMDEYNNIVHDIINAPLLKPKDYISERKYFKDITFYKRYLIPIKKNYTKDDTKKINIAWDVKNNPLDYIKSMVRLDLEFEKLNDNIIKNHTNKEIPPFIMRLFNAVPLRTSIVPKYITIDSAGLISSFTKKDQSSNLIKLKNENRKKNELWKRVFNIDSDSFKRKDYTFNYMIKTDGIGVSIILVKADKKGNPLPEPTKNEAREFLKNISDVPYIDTIKVTKELLKMKIATVDPGHGDLLSCMVQNDPQMIKNTTEKNKIIDEAKKKAEENRENNSKKNKKKAEGNRKKIKKKPRELTIEEIKTKKQNKINNKNKFNQDGGTEMVLKNHLNNIHISYTQRARLMDTKSVKYKCIRDEVKNSDRTVNNKKITKLESELSLHDSKTCNFESFLSYLEIKIKTNRLLYDHYSKEIYRKLNLNTFINTKRSEDDFMNNFKRTLGTPNDTIIVLGDYSADQGVKGRSVVKGKGFRKLFKNHGYKVYLIDEFRTSKLCCHCHHELERFCKIKTKSKIDPLTPCKQGTKAISVASKDILSWKLLKCTNCKVIHNRDHNATKNMLALTKHYFSTNKRLKKFRRYSKKEFPEEALDPENPQNPNIKR